MANTERRCKRCGHPGDWHRHDDHACLSTHPQPCEPQTAPFRCLGYDCMKDGIHGGTPETPCDCQDFVAAKPDAADVDADGYPTEAALDRLANWPHPDFGAALDFAMTLWHWPDFVTRDINAHEAHVLRATPDERYVRFVTGGWSGNEAVIAALRNNFMIRAICWRLSASGGLHIYRYPPTETNNG